MKNRKKSAISLLTLILVVLGIFFAPEDTDTQTPEPQTPEISAVIEGEYYDTPYEVAEYIDLYGELPDNYLTKKEARELGWVAQEGNLWEVVMQNVSFCRMTSYISTQTIIMNPLMKSK